jgi:hypothetical protein
MDAAEMVGPNHGSPKSAFCAYVEWFASASSSRMRATNFSRASSRAAKSGSRGETLGYVFSGENRGRGRGRHGHGGGRGRGGGDRDDDD